MKIAFNKTYLHGNVYKKLEEVIESGQLAGNGTFTKKCQQYFSSLYGFKHSLLTNSATAALEIAALLCDLKKGDEVIVPSFSFVSTAVPFALLGARLRFCESEKERPHMDPNHLKELINSRTRAIVCMHYSGVACNMNEIVKISEEHELILIEDAAHCINSYYDNKALGSFGKLSIFSFHETKNINCGQGGMLVINDSDFIERAEQIWYKGTDRLKMDRGEVDFYQWTDLGSEHMPSEITASILLSQLENKDEILNRRRQLWEYYFEKLSTIDIPIDLPKIDSRELHNHHIFYILARGKEERDEIISFLKSKGIQALFHYLPLNESEYVRNKWPGEPTLKNSENFANRIIRLPLYHDLKNEEIDFIVREIKNYYNSK